MYLVKVFILITIFFSSSIANDFDSIFGENKSKNTKEFDSMFSESKGIKKSDDFMDSLTNAESYNDNRIKFNKLLKKARNEAYTYKNYSKAYKTLNSAYDMNFDNKKVTKLKNDIRNSESKYLRAKREKERKRRAEERKRERMLAEQRRDRQNSVSTMQAFTSALAKQANETNKIIAQNNKLIQQAYNKSYNNKYKNTHSSSKNVYTSSSSTNSYTKKLEEQKRKRDLEVQRKRKELEAQRKKIEKQRLKEQRKRELALKKKREKEERQRARQTYLNRLKNGIRLGAKNCFGEHHVGGSIPKIKPKAVSCIDVSFVAYCRGASVTKRYGVLTNMVGNFAGCFGDTKQVSPKLPCNVKDYIVKVTKVNACN